jgi:phenylpyruvate tautomerase PptA (4-oxalocrotonate tautomerase family)
MFQIHAPPGLSVEAKRKLIKSVNAAVAKAYNNLPDFLILFLEYPQDRVAINGNLNRQPKAPRRAQQVYRG